MLLYWQYNKFGCSGVRVHFVWCACVCVCVRVLCKYFAFDYYYACSVFSAWMCVSQHTKTIFIWQLVNDLLIIWTPWDRISAECYATFSYGFTCFFSFGSPSLLSVQLMALHIVISVCVRIFRYEKKREETASLITLTNLIAILRRKMFQKNIIQTHAVFFSFFSFSLPSRSNSVFFFSYFIWLAALFERA